MNKILVNTHKKENIELLKIRDFYFDKARILNRIKLYLLAFPIIVAFVLAFFAKKEIIGKFKDIIVGGITLISFIPIFIINRNISKNVTISNTFREEYDVRVLEMNRNEFAYDYSVLEKYKDIKQKERYINKKHNFGKKYEYWYDEIFSEDLIKNTICCQMDNIIYTYFVYKAYRKKLWIRLGIILFLAAGLSLAASIVFNDYVSFFLCALVSIMPLLQMFLESIITSTNLVNNNINLKNMIMKDNTKFDKEKVRTLQDVIITNRDNSLFISKRDRNAFLKDNSPYYSDLNDVTLKVFKGENITMPSSSKDIEVLSFDGKKRVTLDVVQNKLTKMLNDTVWALNKNNVKFFVDGGTLIGAVREKGNYIFWDDDIDLGILETDIESLIAKLSKDLPNYEFQTYSNEEYYSPRLSSLRIREKNDSSIVYEKDSPLYNKYFRRGLFIDIYVYHPIYKSLCMDKIYRRLFLHNLNSRIRDIEYKCLLNEEKYLPKFIRLKAKYLRRVNRYSKIAKNEEYYSYLPTYIDKSKKAGPYLKKENLLGNSLKEITFASIKAFAPANPEKVLEEIYGKDWNKSPYLSINELQNLYKDKWTFKKEFPVTCLKHLSYIDIKK